MPRFIVLSSIMLFVAACAADEANPDGGTANRDSGVVADAGFDDAGFRDAGTPDSGVLPPFEFTTAAFADGAAVPVQNQCGPPLVQMGAGMNISPPISWTAGPAETMSYAVVIRDRSAGGLVHWAIYDIAPNILEIAEDVPAGYQPTFPVDAKQAEIQGSGYFGYFGPCSGGRGNTYEWTVHALPEATLAGVTRNTTENVIAATIEAASIASASFTGRY